MTPGPTASSLSVCILQRYLPPDPSGAGKQAITLGRALMERGHEVLLMGERSGHNQPQKTDGIPVIWIPGVPPEPNRLDILLYWARLARALLSLRNRVDVLHIHATSFLHAGAIPVAKLLGKPVVVRSSLEGEVPDSSRSRSEWLHHRFLRQASGFIVISRRLRREYLSGGFPSEKIQRIPNGVNTSSYRPVSEARKRQLREELGLPLDASVLTYHGVFVERKSIHWALPRLERYLSELDLVLLLIGGPGRDENKTGYFSRLKKRIESSPARDSIVVTGFKEDVHRYLQASDMYLLPSTGEGLPNALLEAMATGLIPIVSRTSGSEEVIDDGSSGFLFEPRDDASFSASIEDAIDAESTEQGRRVTQRAVQEIRKHYSIDAIADQYSERYRGLL